MKLLKALTIFLGVIFLVLLIFISSTFAIIKNLKIKEIVENEIEQTLGIGVAIDEITFSPFLAHITVKGITIHNPKGFQEPELAYIDYIHFVVDPFEIVISKKPNIYLFAVDLVRLNIVKNKDGKVNLKELVALKDTKNDASDKTPFYFDVVVLSVGEVTYFDHAAGGKMHKYPIGIKNQAFVDLKDENDVVKLVVYYAIQNTDIGKLVNLTITPVVSQVSDTVDAAWGLAKAGAKGMGEIAAMPFKLLFGK